MLTQPAENVQANTLLATASVPSTVTWHPDSTHHVTSDATHLQSGQKYNGQVIPPAVSEPFMAAGEDSVVHVEPSDNVVQDPPVLVHQQTQVDVVGDTSA
ncbi:hypothetical protein V6N12_073939 [Hibiscus sabdariffa]|uniref:Uncharacterized protein n=1 Tax=Hibiscus sabdariffa TaxID=183260 RepID=A0ABR1ZKY8_9ROSI